MSVQNSIDEIIASVNSQFTIGTQQYYDAKQDFTGLTILTAIGQAQYLNSLASMVFAKEITRPSNTVAPIIGLPRKYPTQSEGLVSFQGIPGSIMNAGTQIQSPFGNLYTTLNSATVNSASIPISLISSNGAGLITVTTSIPHNLASNFTVNISGVTNPAYDTTGATITVTSISQFTFNKTITAGNSSGGNVLCDFLSVNVKSQAYGSALNVDRAVRMTTLNTLTGINNFGYVQYTKILGGSDLESQSDYDRRTVESVSKKESAFNEQLVFKTLIQYPEVTRVFARGTATLGEVRVRFMMDNRQNPFPDSQDSLNVKNAILNGFGTQSSIWPLYKPSSYLDVGAPIPNPCNISFNYVVIGGYTSELKERIQTKLKTLFSNTNVAGYEVKVYEYSIINEIAEALDEDKTLSREVRNNIINGVVITYTNPSFIDSIATLGTLTYAI